MGRKVFVTSEMSIDERIERVAEVNSTAALMWPWVLTAFDDWGRMEASSSRLKLAVFPAVPHVTRETVEEAMLLFDREGLLLLYEVDGKRYASINPVKWFKYQTHIRAIKRERDDSKHPPPSDDARMRASARGCAQVRVADGRCEPSPSPSPSPTPTKEEHMCVSQPTATETHVTDLADAAKARARRSAYPAEFEEFWRNFDSC